MVKKSLFLFIFIFIFNFISFLPVQAADTIYGRNGEVYVMVGEGDFRGVYKSQDVDPISGERVPIPGGKFLFGAKDQYYSISVDQFRNIYVLSAYYEETATRPDRGTYYALDKPAGEGIVGIGADKNNDLFYDVINYAPGPSYTYHGTFNLGFFLRLVDTTFYYDGVTDDFNDKAGAEKRLVGAANKPPDDILKKYLDDFSPAKFNPMPAMPFLLSTPDQPIEITFPNGNVRNDTIPGNVQAGCGKEPWFWGTHAGGCPCSGGNEIKNIVIKGELDNYQIRRIGKQVNGSVTANSDSWYPGFFARWYYHGDFIKTRSWGRTNGGNNFQASGNWQRRYNFLKQYINLWVTEWVESIPKNLVLDGITLPQLKTETDVETVFNTANISYKADFASACGEDHADTKLGIDEHIKTTTNLSLATTGAGRRYVFSSPNKTVKQGAVALLKDGTGVIKYGVPVGKSGAYKGKMGGYLPITEKTLAVGAATMNEKEDWVYVSPEKEGNWTVIDYCIADQWDGNGGVEYRLLMNPETQKKKLKWNKYGDALANDPDRGYKPFTADPERIKVGELEMPDDVKCITADGSGSIYYLTKARPVYDGTSKPLGTFDPKDETKTIEKPVPIVEDNSGLIVFAWLQKYKVRAASEVYYCYYYSKDKSNKPDDGALIKGGDKGKKINDFTVGFETVIVREVFKDADAKQLKYRDKAKIIGTPAEDIKLDIATINLAGPPRGNDERDCVDIVSTNANGTSVSGIKFNNPTSSGISEVNVDKSYVDVISEDTTYKAIMENTPPTFSNDIVHINTKSGTELEDTNKNGFKGGFPYSILPRTATYYWKVEMIEPMRRVITPDYPSEKVTAPPAKWPPADRPAGSQAVNFSAEEGWYVSKPTATGEADSEFRFTPKEPGIYKVSLIAGTKRYNYDLMPYPSYITDRDGYLSDYKYSYFDNDNTSEKNYGKKDPTEDYIAERYVVVKAKSTEGDDYITNVEIKGPKDIDENKAGVWTASADVKFIRSFLHETGTPDAKKLMETYNGIGVWDYPEKVDEEWILKEINPRYDVGENYVIGAKAQPANCYSGPASGRTGTIEAKLRNFGEVPPNFKILDPVPAEILAPAPVKVYGTSSNIALWVEGAGTTSDPAKALNRADRGCIEYEWYLAAEKKDGSNSSYLKKNSKGEPDILIAKGRLCDEMKFPADIKDLNNPPAVSWSPASYISPNRKYKIEVNLRYAFDMPLEPGYYYLYIKFKYPKLKWEGRSALKNKDGKFVDDKGNIVDEKNAAFAHYDLVPNGCGETVPDDCASIKNNAPEPIGYKIKVIDKQSPQAYFIGNDPNYINPSEATALNATIPACGVPFKGATTGDAYPSAIKYNVCDNNPNTELTSNLVAIVGPNMAGLTQTDFAATKLDDLMVSFTDDKVVSVLEKMIIPKVDKAGIGKNRKLHDVAAANLDFTQYPGFDQASGDAPFRRARYSLPEKTITENQLPYDMIGSIPLFVNGSDANGNKICDANGDGSTSEVNLKFTTDSDNKSRNREYSNAPANIGIKDNDSPTINISVMISRDAEISRYSLNSPKPENLGSDHTSFHDVTDWDPTSTIPRLTYSGSGFGPVSVSCETCDLNGNVKSTEFSSEKMSPDGANLKQFLPTGQGNDDISVDNSTAEPVYRIKFNDKNVVLGKCYDDYSAAGVEYLDFSKIFDGTLEIIEDSRTKFEIIVCDNVDGIITPAAYDEKGILKGRQYYLDTKNLGDKQTIDEVLASFNFDKAKLSNGTEIDCIATYGVFRNPTPPGSPRPYMFYAVKDNSGNATAIKIPTIILHTLMKRNVINVESRRSQ